MKNILVSIKVEINKAIASVKKFTDAIAEANEEAKKATGTAGRFAGICSKLTIPNVAALASSIGKIGSEFAKAADSGFSFGQSMADLSAITGIVGDDLRELEGNARRFGKESGLGAETAARAYTVLASQIQVADIGMEGLNKLQEKSITLAQASGMSLDAAAESLAGTINQFGLGADEADRVINVLAAGSKYGAAEISELSQSFKVVGAAASAMGLDVESTAGALEVLSKANLKGAEAGTALRNIILKLNTSLGIDLGEVSLSTALDALKPKLNDATYLSKLFGAENIAAAQFLIQNASAVDEMTQSLTGTNVAEEQAAIRTQTTAQRMAELRAQMDDIKISITNAAGAFGPLVMMFSENAEAVTLVSSLIGTLIGKLGVINQAVVKLTGSTILQNAASMVATTATKGWSLAQASLNAVMSRNPIAMVVIAIGTLVAAVIYCYNHFEGFRKVCDKVWSSVKSIASATWDYLVTAFERASKVIREAWQWINNFFGIKDKQSAEDAAAAIDRETDAIDKNTNAKKKNGEFKLDFGNTGIGDNGGEETKEVKLNGLDETAIRKKLQEVQARMDAAPTMEAKAEILPEVVRLEDMLRWVQQRVDDARIRLRMDARPDLGIGDDMRGPVGPIVDGEKAVGETANVRERMQELFRDPLEIYIDTKGLDRSRESMEDAASAISQLGGSLAGLGSAIEVPALDVIGTIAQAIANIALSYSQALAGAAKLGPFGWLAFGAAGLAQMTAIIASVRNATAFANGGIVSGPTYALVGEYAGASNNPEVIAPLDRLRQLIGTAEGDGVNGGEVRFRISGDVLEGVLERRRRRVMRG